VRVEGPQLMRMSLDSANGVRREFWFRKPSIKKRIAARTSWKRVVRHRLGLKAPRGWGWLTNPRRAAYNRVYNRTTVGCSVLLAGLASVAGALILVALD
jgi:hypothetical protein